jgi:hypothetical protein
MPDLASSAPDPAVDEWDEGRDIDVLFLAAHSERRARVLAQCGDVLRRYTTRIAFTEGDPTKGVADEHTLLRRARVLLIVHRDGDTAFEWPRVMKAIHHGAVVVTERSTGMAPLRAGHDLMVSSTQALPWVLDFALGDDARLRTMRNCALETVRRSKPTIATHGEQLLDLTRDEEASALPARGGDEGTPALTALRVDLLDVSRRLARLTFEATAGRKGDVEIFATTPAYMASSTPDVTVAISTFERAEDTYVTLASVARSTGVKLEVVVVDDGSMDDTSAQLNGWLEQHHDVPIVGVRHRVYRGLGAARNTALDLARGRFFLVLDAGNELAPHGLAQLVAACDEPDVALTYGMLESFDATGPTRLTNGIVWGTPGLARGEFPDAMAMVRTRALRKVGGFTTDPQLHGWEHYDLWCALAEQGWRGTLVPSIVGRRRAASGLTHPFVDLDHEHALDRVRARRPRIMMLEQPAHHGSPPAWQPAG